MLNVTDISSGYGAMRILKDVSLSVCEGELVGAIGANGAGKTTLLRTISGLLTVKNGSITFGDIDITNLAADEIVRMGLVHVPEGRRIFGPLSTLDNLVLGCYLRYGTLGPGGREKLLDFVYELFPILYERREQRAGSLSGGEQQMLAVGRGLMSEPKLLLLDEFTLGLAPLVIASLCDTFRFIRTRGVTILLAEQNAQATLTLADRIYVLETGSVAAEGPGEFFTTEKLRELYIA
jgi:branched-chain amino acid transport system ATP-binding protein